MIQFVECKTWGYPARTEENVKNSDVTIAFAVDFSSPGEILTRNLCKKHSKLYISFPVDDKSMNELFVFIDGVADKIKKATNENFRLNVAGNGIYTFYKNNKWSQEALDYYMGMVLHNLNKEIRIGTVRSGGQSGADEAGLKAAHWMGIDCICLAPRGWKFRDINDTDISSEKQFKQRFL